jgi:arabinose-5-phosphate isomerase
MTQQIIKIAKKVIDAEINGLKVLSKKIDKKFVKAVNILKKNKSKIIVTGVGKSGIIAKKVASTLSSTGSPSQFIHSTEASHGDLGVINKKDVILAFTFSGKTIELNDIFIYSKEKKIPLIIITGKSNSKLENIATVCIEISNLKEACPLDLAPTTSTTVMLALGDAFAVSLMISKKFTKKDFYSYHPGGQLGKKLLLVKNIMHSGKKLPLIKENVPMSTAIIEMTKKRFGCLGVVSKTNTLIGIITDGDLRRHMGNSILEKKTTSIMTKKPKTVNKDIFASEALDIMKKSKITQVFITENNKPIGILHIHDCIELELA